MYTDRLGKKKTSGDADTSYSDDTKQGQIAKQAHDRVRKVEKKTAGDLVHDVTGLEEGMTKDAMMNDAEKMSLEQFCDKYVDEDWLKEFYHTAVGTEDVEEGLDANQKRVGQLGPTEKVKNNNIGKLVGANESLELNEMDKSQPSSDRGGESSGNPYAKGGKATPIKAKDAEKDAEKALNKSMDKAHKKDVKEGQEDLDAILRIIRK